MGKKNLSLIFIFIVGALCFFLKAAPHNGEIFELEQPDGSSVQVRVWGDEFYQRVESLEGYTLIRDKNGWICYAKLSPDSSEFISTGIIYRNTLDSNEFNKKGEPLPPKHIKLPRKYRLKKHQSIRKALLKDSSEISPAPSGDDTTGGTINLLPGVTPVTGNFVGLTILVDFSDKEKTIPLDSVEDFLNKRGYTGYRNNGSVRDYFFDVSGGKVDYTNKLFGYYRAKNPKTYYDNSSVSFGTRAMELVLEALNWVKSQGFDFSTLSTDSRKRILAINVLYAGSPSQGWSQGLWPHQGTIMNFSANGVTARKYQISALGSGVTIGTFCHENGHMLFNWADLYDYGGESSGVGNYCIMCATGSTNPVPPCAYLRDYSGWDAVTDITDMVVGTILSIIPNTNTSFVYRNKSNNNEMFYIEARRRLGRSRTLPDSGFMIWHIDRTGSNNNEAMSATSHYLVSLEQADNLFELEKGINSGKVGDLFRKGYKDRFDDSTQPSAKWWNGSNSNLKIWNMSGVGDTMSFSIGEIKGATYNVVVSAGEHGSIAPSGKLSAVGGSTLRFVIKPDSGYQIEEIWINGQSAKISDTIVIEKINSDYEVKVIFGLKGFITIFYPQKGDILYAGDTVTLRWRLRSQTIDGYNISYSIDGGKSFNSIVNNLSKNDTLFKWKVPLVESDSCIIKISDLDGNPTVNSEYFLIKKKPVLSIVSEMINITVERGKIKEYTLPIENKGSGELMISATTARQVKKIFINELSVGSDSAAPDG
ncbi:MAG: M6 family metalloprotease domain-containing protein, partial [Chitinispirillaceae bacterium]|nr:M6 family metalloprotease domain-containing protein [Chitinispirillaceae bacterium]